MISSRSPRIEWEPLLKRLTAAAEKLFRQHQLSDVLRGIGDSPEDLAIVAAMEFFQGEGVKWRPKTANEDPFPLIWTVMRNNLIDLIRTASHQRTTLIEDTQGDDENSKLEGMPTLDQGLHDLLNRPKFGFTAVEAAILAESFYPFAEGDQDLIDVIDVVVHCQCRKRREIAEWLDITPQDVTDRWEKLRYNYTRHH